MITQINPTIPVETPKGSGSAHFLIDYGEEHDLYWVVFINATDECWTFNNSDIRIQNNLTMGRNKKKHEWRKIWETDREKNKVIKFKDLEVGEWFKIKNSLPNIKYMKTSIPTENKEGNIFVAVNNLGYAIDTLDIPDEEEVIPLSSNNT